MAKKTSPRINKTLQHKKELIKAMIKSLGVVTKACELVGVSRTLFYQYYNSDPEFSAACDECQEIAVDFAESQLHKRIKEGSDTAIIFFLKTKGKKRGYIERSEIGLDSNTIEITPILPPHED